MKAKDAVNNELLGKIYDTWFERGGTAGDLQLMTARAVSEVFFKAGIREVVGGNVASVGGIEGGLNISERDFQEWLRQLAIIYGYLYFHVHRSIHSPSGFPDVVMVRLEPEPRLIFCELKTDDLKHSQPSIDQWGWLYILQHIGKPVECYLFRPADRDFIEKCLK